MSDYVNDYYIIPTDELFLILNGVERVIFGKPDNKNKNSIMYARYSKYFNNYEPLKQNIS